MLLSLITNYKNVVLSYREPRDAAVNFDTIEYYMYNKSIIIIIIIIYLLSNHIKQ